MMDFLISLLIVAVIIHVVYLILGNIQLPGTIRTIVYLIVGISILIWFLGYAGILDSNLQVP